MTSKHERLNETAPTAVQADGKPHTTMAFAILSILLVGAAALSLPACQKNRSGMAGYMLPIGPGSLGAQLYRANCAGCHGVTGRGEGIAAIALNIKPRDFYNEPFRYISSTDGVATDADLAQTIRVGRVEGEMPAGPWFTDEETMALAQYVREINRLGWAERLGAEFQGDDALDPDEIEEISWDRVTSLEPYTVSAPSASFRPDTSIGRDLYLQTCASCHGPTGTGDGLLKPLDEQGNPIAVRNLTRDPIRGGDSPEELFKRIRSGIPGTPMPAQLGYTDDEIWQLVHYTRFLMGRPLLGRWQTSFEQSLTNEGDY